MKRSLGLLAAAGLLWSGAALAQGAGPDRAVAALLAQGDYWRAQNRPELALPRYQRVLAVDPNNPAALAGAAQSQLALGDTAAAETLTSRLRQVTTGDDPRLAGLESAARASNIRPDQLAEARRLAQAGRSAEAVARYRGLFGAEGPPDELAVEFFSTLAGTQDGYGAGVAGLAGIARRNPSDSRAQLAYAQSLTWQTPTRGQGIERLRALARLPGGAAAQQAWRQAVLWSGPTEEAVPQLQAYLAQYPDDAAVRARLAEAQDPTRRLAVEAGQQRQRGFALLEANQPRDAGRQFEDALARNPADPDALGGLGIVRLREGRTAEAQELLQRAIAAAPESAAQWQQALDGAGYGLDLAEGRRLAQRGDATAAEAVLRRALARRVTDTADAEIALGDLLVRRGDGRGAEEAYRSALARRPDNREALTGLARALRRQDRLAEATEIERRLPRDEGPGSATAAIRRRAAAAPDTATAVALLQSAVATNPTDPWVRLDLARLLLRQGQGAEGRAIVEELALRGGGTEAAFAAALFAEADARLADAAAWIDRVPAPRRSPEMAALAARARAASEVEAAVSAAASGRMFEGRQRLLAIAARPDTTGSLAAAVIRGFGRLNDPRGAEEAARIALLPGRAQTPAARLAVASAMVGAGLEQQASAIGREVAGDPRVTPDERRQAQALQTSAEIRTADRLNEQGNQAAAFEALRPVLTRDPMDPAGNAALARLYQGAQRPREASEIAETLLSRDPRNIDARTTAVDAAIAARDLPRAEALVAEAKALAPSDARVSIMEARVARAAGDSRRALRSLELAAEQRRAATGGGFAAAPRSAAYSDNPFRAGTGAIPVSATLASADPLAAEIAREAQRLRDENAAQVVFLPGVRTRSGSNGLDRLTEIGAAVEGRMPAAGGSVTLRAAAVSLDAGSLDRTLDSNRRFGTNALGGPAGGPVPRDPSASGVGFQLSYRRDNFAADVASSPLGFRTTTILGGIEAAPAIGQNVRLRVVGERRSMTDSVLSWAGMEDPRTGTRWGAVTRSGGRAQLEYSAGPLSAYAGGGYSVLDGDNVRDNTRYELGAGMAYRVINTPDEEVTTGINLTHFGYQRNLRYFTLGHGGYFSPQSYTALTVPVDWRVRSGDLSWRLGASIGYAAFREDSAPYFPNDSGLQGTLEGRAAADPTIRTRYDAQSQSGVVLGLRGDMEYRLTQQLRVGGLLSFERSADYNEARGLFYARYLLE
jgi:tetratricopeptide (TPR) repeat protein